MKPKVIFICTHNSARSQMAEGVLKFLAGDKMDVYSAGTVVTGVNPFAIKVMAERGIDISKQYSKHIRDLSDMNFDYVITVCDKANKACPTLSGKYKHLHWSIDDPGEAPARDEDRLEAFRETRDLLFRLIEREFNHKR